MRHAQRSADRASNEMIPPARATRSAAPAGQVGGVSVGGPASVPVVSVRSVSRPPKKIPPEISCRPCLSPSLGPEFSRAKFSQSRSPDSRRIPLPLLFGLGASRCWRSGAEDQSSQPASEQRASPRPIEAEGPARLPPWEREVEDQRLTRGREPRDECEAVDGGDEGRPFAP